jgi:hypothetical protein
MPHRPQLRWQDRLARRLTFGPSALAAGGFLSHRIQAAGTGLTRIGHAPAQMRLGNWGNRASWRDAGVKSSRFDLTVKTSRRPTHRASRAPPSRAASQWSARSGPRSLRLPKLSLRRNGHGRACSSTVCRLLRREARRDNVGTVLRKRSAQTAALSEEASYQQCVAVLTRKGSADERCVPSLLVHVQSKAAPSATLAVEKPAAAVDGSVGTAPQSTEPSLEGRIGLAGPSAGPTVGTTAHAPRDGRPPPRLRYSVQGLATITVEAHANQRSFLGLVALRTSDEAHSATG